MKIVCFKGRQFDASDNFKEICDENDWEYFMVKGGKTFVDAYYARANRRLHLAEICLKGTEELKRTDYAILMSNFVYGLIEIVSKERALNELVPF